MQIRRIKIQEFRESKRKNAKFFSKPIPKPRLILTGHWLKESGIEIGETVTIQVFDDHLVIRP